MKRILVLILCILCIIGAYGLGSNHPFRQNDSAVVTDHQLLESSLNEIGELATAEFSFKLSQTAEKEALKVPILDWNIPFTQSTILYSYQGTVKAGIQFGEIEAFVNEKDKIISVSFPKSQILGTEIYNDSLEVYNEKVFAFNSYRFEDFNKSQEDLKETAKNCALESGILSTADENARILITGIVSGLYNLDEYELKFI